MQKTKRLLSLIFAMILALGLVPAMAFADDAEGEMHTMLISPSAGAEVYVTIAVQGAFATDKDGNAVAVRPVTVSDRNGDGIYDIDEALYAAHEAFYDGGAEAGYASAMTDYGLSLVKLWGDTSGSVGYMVSDQSPWNLGGAVNAGDHVCAYVYADQTYWSDAYSCFNAYTCQTKPGSKVELTLKYNSFDENWNTVSNALEGADVTVNGISRLLTTNAEGKVTVSFDEPGTYVISATSDKTIVPPACAIEVVEVANKSGFTDVADDSPYADAVAWAVANKVTTGKTELEFKPEDNLSRGQAVTFLWRAKGCPEPATTENPFTDIDETSPYYKAVLWAVEQGITTGYTATEFKPHWPCNRAHMITFLWRAAGKPAPKADCTMFFDVDTNSFYMDALSWAYYEEIADGLEPHVFGPAAPCVRGQAVDFIYRALD